MSRRMSVVLAAIAFVALVVVMLGPSVGASRGENRERFAVRATFEEQSIVDVGEQGPSQGDQAVFFSSLWKHGEQVGHNGVVCTLVSVAEQLYQCVATNRFIDSFRGGGQITVQTLFAGEDRFTVPVTGGSGAFSGASGEVHVTRLSERSERLSFDLEF